MSYTGLTMRPNRFRPGLCPGPHWGSLQLFPPRPPSWWGRGQGRPVSKDLTSPRLFWLRASVPRASLSRPPNTPENKPYGLNPYLALFLRYSHTYPICIWRPVGSDPNKIYKDLWLQKIRESMCYYTLSAWSYV